MKKRILFIFILLPFIILLSSCFAIEFVERTSFNYLASEYFYLHLLDPMNVNFTLKDPQGFGIEELTVVPYSFSEEEYQQLNEYLLGYKERLDNIKYKSLTKAQQITYDIIYADLEHMIVLSEYPYHFSRLGVYFGYQTQLPIILSEYHFYTEEDIEYYFQYLTTTQATFEGLISFEEIRIEKGFGFPTKMYQQMAEQCEKLLNNDEFFLLPIFDDKVANCSFLSENQIANYILQHQGYIEEFLTAYEYLKDELYSFEVTNAFEGGLSGYPDGDYIYESIIKNVTGSNQNIDDIYDYLSAKNQREMNTLRSYILSNPNKIDDILSPNVVQLTNEREIYDLIRNKAAADFPFVGKDYNVRFEYIHPSLQEHVAPAFYFLSPIDATVEEVIYISNALFEDPTDAYFTIGHEGIPGHMLQHNILKASNFPEVRMVLSEIGYAEGWAVYVESYIASYLDADKALIDAHFANKRINYINMCLADIEINYYDMTFDDFYNWLSDLYDITADEGLEMFYQIKEKPGYYLQYYLSYYLVLDLKASFKEKVSNLNLENIDLEFHKFYLTFGPAPFYIMEDWLDDYINNTY